MDGQGRNPRRFSSRVTCLPLLALFLLAGLARPRLTLAQTGEELTSREAEPTFRVRVTRALVLANVIVRDSKGKPVGNLRKEDFRLFDNGKPQTLAYFSVETPSSKPSAAAVSLGDEGEPDSEALPETVLAPSTPLRYLALFFDDIHMKFEDIARTREAAEGYLASALTPGDRVGVFTSSGQKVLDFTDDQAQLHEALRALFPRPVAARRDYVCPEILDYQAYLIVHLNDPFALEIAMEEAYQCHYEGTQTDPVAARAAAHSLAMQEAFSALQRFQLETEYVLRGLHQLVRRMAALPGQRSIVLVSPGFLMVTAEYRVNEVIERALRSNVIVNTLDAKGLYAPVPLGDASHAPVIVTRRADLVGKKAQLYLDQIEQASGPLRTLAYDSGGEFFHNSNDFDAGFRRVGSLPEVFYVLGFTPQNPKLDGRFHSLKVSLTVPGKYAVQARSGYYAPKKPQDPEVQKKEEIEQAIFSHDELSELPIEVHTQFFKFNEVDARLSVLTRLDLRFVQFRKENGRNLNNLTLITALFDRDGKYMMGKQKTLEFRLLDTSLEKLSQSGITTKTSFDVKPGIYLVRQVVRDAEGAHISALNRTVEIPF